MAKKWAYGVTTTAARRSTLLPRTLKSLEVAGFNEPHLFVDGCYDQQSWVREFKLPVTSHYPQIGAFPNWYLALTQLWMISKGQANYYAIFQDDLVTCQGLRSFLEGVQWPICGYLNLYEFPHNWEQNKINNQGKDIRGWYKGIRCREGKAPPGYQRGLGAVALVFNNDGVELLLNSRSMLLKCQDKDFGTKKIDGAIVSAMNDKRWYEFVHNPSLVQHTGEVTTIKGNVRHPQALSFPGENYNLMDLYNDPYYDTIPDQRSYVIY